MSNFTNFLKNVLWYWHGLMLWNIQKVVWVSGSQTENCNGKISSMNNIFAVPVFIHKNLLMTKFTINNYNIMKYAEIDGSLAKLIWTYSSRRINITVFWSSNSLILFWIRKNCLSSGRSPLVYKFTRTIKQ